MRTDPTLLPNRAGDEERRLMRWQNRAEFAEKEAERYRAALKEIARANLARCSAGSLADIARKALGEG